MLDIKDISIILIALIPYIALAAFLFVFKKVSLFPSNLLFYGVFSMLLAAAGGVVGFLLIVSRISQTSTTFSQSTFNWIIAVTLAIMCFVGELFRYFMLKESKVKEGSGIWPGLAFGTGFSAGVFVFTLVGILFFINPSFKIGALLAGYAAIHVLIQLFVSVPCYELIKANNYAFILIGTLYYLSIFMMSLLSSSVILNIAVQIIILIISAALFFVFMPSRKDYE